MSRVRLVFTASEILLIGVLLALLRGSAVFVQIIAVGLIVAISSCIFAKNEIFQRRLQQRANYKRLLFEKQRADLIAESISDGIILLRDQEIHYANPIATRILALPPGQSVVGFNVEKNDVPRATPGIRVLGRALRSSLPHEMVFEDGVRKSHYLVQSFPLNSSDKAQPNTLVLAQDVTLLKESQEAKIHFLGTLSHEVKTPVTSLTMAIHLLHKARDQFPNQTHRNLITTCAHDVDRLRILLDDLMTVSRFDLLAQRLELQRIDLGKLVSHAVQSFQMQAQEKQVELIYSADIPAARGKVSQDSKLGQGLFITVDATKIAWALSNLLTNALRHTPRGGKVGVNLIANADSAEVRVKDTGPGIDIHRQQRIFEKFSSVYDLRVARSGTVGAGLAIAKEIVKAHGGEIWVSSQLGGGAEFGFRLPLRPSQFVADFWKTEPPSMGKEQSAEAMRAGVLG